jgi:hypothetical protein
MPDLFRTCRVAAFEKWQTGTNRTGCDINECYEDSYECRWQSHAKDLNYKHISLFCSLADWSCNISDLLSDTRYDNYDFGNVACHDVLARYYTRLMMVIAEHLVDLQRIAHDITQSAKVREQISSPEDKNWVNSLHGFVNSVCKHKSERQNIHHRNHHLPHCFDDMNSPCCGSNPVQLSTLDLADYDSIQYPKLTTLVGGVLTAYSQVNQLLMADEVAFRRICDKFNDPTFRET